VVERKGRPLAAIVPIAKLEQMDRFARQRAKGVLEAQTGGDLTQEQTDELAAEAVVWARQQTKKATEDR
jgi:antitoxin (DNA-binding transcriptional repressor) of toxin-antitoxin stability system